MLKKLLATTSAFLLGAAIAQGGAISFNTLGAGADARPLVDIGGTPLDVGAGYIAGGTFNTLTDAQITDMSRAAGESGDWSAVLGDFAQFGAAASIPRFAGIAEFSASVPIVPDGPFDGKNVYFVVGNAADSSAESAAAADAAQWLIYKDDETFDASKEPTFAATGDFIGATDDSFLAGRLGGQVVLTGTPFEQFGGLQSLELQGIPEPSTALLLLSGLGSMVFFRRRR